MSILPLPASTMWLWLWLWLDKCVRQSWLLLETTSCLCKAPHVWSSGLSVKTSVHFVLCSESSASWLLLATCCKLLGFCLGLLMSSLFSTCCFQIDNRPDGALKSRKNHVMCLCVSLSGYFKNTSHMVLKHHSITGLISLLSLHKFRLIPPCWTSHPSLWVLCTTPTSRGSVTCLGMSRYHLYNYCIADPAVKALYQLYVFINVFKSLTTSEVLSDL